jgi:hypothetical protein
MPSQSLKADLKFSKSSRIRPPPARRDGTNSSMDRCLWRCGDDHQSWAGGGYANCAAASRVGGGSPARADAAAAKMGCHRLLITFAVRPRRIARCPTSPARARAPSGRAAVLRIAPRRRPHPRAQVRAVALLARAAVGGERPGCLGNRLWMRTARLKFCRASQNALEK